jgi:diaminopimelate decarboxylase|tara:strand:+ start:869 stop:2134 length:1266 start_codon:yes stop_codon:yes gene_type:complete
MIDAMRFLTYEDLDEIQMEFGTPCFVYDEATLRTNAREVLNFPNAYGLFPRYAMKAAPTAAILRIFNEEGLGIDASSVHEVERAVRAGYGTESISLSTQELADDFIYWAQDGIRINLCSLNQIDKIGKWGKVRRVGLRFNPGKGSGGNNRTNVGGPASSFGIWKDDLEKAISLCQDYRLVVDRIHTHIGSGSDPEVWKTVASMTLDLARSFPSVESINLGGGYKVARMPDEKPTDLQEVGSPVKELFKAFAEETGRELRLEIEPGTYLLAHACSLVTRVQDVTSTGKDGYRFLKLDSGMTEILRPSLYGAQHPIHLVCEPGQQKFRESIDQVVVGHCCESGDLLTPAPGDPEALSTRNLPRGEIGDFCVIEGAGAYCSSMAAKNYNSFPEAAEVLRKEDGRLALIRKRQTFDQIIENEVVP